MATTPVPGLEPSASDPVGYREHKDEHLTRLRKTEEQVRGLSRMIEEDRYCIEVLLQVAAITRACRRSPQACSATTPETVCWMRSSQSRGRPKRSSTNSPAPYAA
ncbi:metal-sensitive transcriptional regulator [Streptomyces iakyrus]|uniref:metal-sensitive transcriptional regulator n=1 Tax=Streptomyces iakyrus TaxID=68219 RepID=UPI0033B812B8